MHLTKRVFMAACAATLGLAMAGPAAMAQGQASDPENTMIITLKDGNVVIRLRPDLAPKHVAQIKTLVREGEYDNVAFHRVIPGFMAQTGDVQFGNSQADGFSMQMAGRGGSDKPDLPAEFSDLAFERGVVGMARSQSPNSANSQFFIMFEPGYFLNGQYTVVGEVTEGMEVVDAIHRGTGPNGAVVGAPDLMKTVTVTE